MSSRTECENAVSSSCILAPEGPVACEVGGRQGGQRSARWWPGGAPSPPPGGAADTLPHERWAKLPLEGRCGWGPDRHGAAPMPSKAGRLPFPAGGGLTHVSGI